MSKSTFFTGQPVFSQLLKFLPRHIINGCAREYRSDLYYKKFNTHHHLITMLYACFQNCTSLREVITGIRACEGKLQPLGLRYFPCRSTLADANKNRSYEVFEQLFYKLIEIFRKLYPDSRNLDPYIKRLIIIDSTTITLFKDILKGAGVKKANGKKKGGIKVHMAVRAKEDIPGFIKLSEAALADSQFMKYFNPEKGSIIVMDKAYNWYKELNRWQRDGADWVTRIRVDAHIEVIKELRVSKESKSAGVLSDKLILMGKSNSKIEQVKCRLIEYYDSTLNMNFKFITSSLKWTSKKVASIYKQRWQIEILFRRLKQNMPLEYFLGDNENAIKIQIYCALMSDLLLQIALKGIKRKWAYANLSSFVRLHLMNYTHLHNFLSDPYNSKIYDPPPQSNQISLFLSG